MSLISTIMRHMLTMVMTILLLLASSTPAYADYGYDVIYWPPGYGPPPECDHPICTPTMLEGAKTTEQGVLYIQSAESAQPNLVTGIEGASDNPADIVNLVDSALKVWRSAFNSETLPPLEVAVAWAEFSEVEDQALAVHICGLPDKLDPRVCSETDRTKSTIVFNSNLLNVPEVDENGESKNIPVKLFLDSDPLNSSVFGPVEEITDSSSRVRRSPVLLEKVSDAYVVDLFTVALHEVGHAMGYAPVNEPIRGATDSYYDELDTLGIKQIENENILAYHLGELDGPDVMSLYVPFATRECPSNRDVGVVAKVGPYVPDTKPYQLISVNPCQVVNKERSSIEFENLGNTDRLPERLEDPRLSIPKQPIFREVPILPRDR